MKISLQQQTSDAHAEYSPLIYLLPKQATTPLRPESSQG
jgi:hypothetical protein